MPDLDRDLLRKLAGWRTDGLPVSSLYLDVDGRRYPRRQDYLLRGTELCDRLRRQADGLPRRARDSICKDILRIQQFLEGLERRLTRGVALFSCSGAGLWEEVLVPRPVPDRAGVDDHPYVLRLEALIATYQSFCTVIVDREKARIFLARMGRIQEETSVFDEVPGQHAQGGWAQLNNHEHIEELVARHLKRVADVLLRYLKRRRFDHLILAGPEELLPQFERGLHDYVRRRIAMRTTLAMTAAPAEVLAKSLAVEEAVEAERERRLVDRLLAEAAAGRQAVTGLSRVIDALNDGRVDTLVVPFGASADGFRCDRCGRLSTGDGTCAVCGGTRERVPDVIESVVAMALRQSSRVEPLSFTGGNGRNGEPIGALLRF
jgi:peptide chain release factor subunit 1